MLLCCLLLGYQETQGLHLGRHVLDGSIVCFSVLKFSYVFVSVMIVKQVLNIKHLERRGFFKTAGKRSAITPSRSHLLRLLSFLLDQGFSTSMLLTFWTV